MKDILTRTVRPVSALGRGGALGGVPVDLVGLVGFVLVAAVVLAGSDASSPVLRALLGLPLLFFAPGYGIVSILFPRSSPLESGGSRRLIGQTRAVSDRERAALAFGLSVAAVPLLALAMAAASVAYTGPAVVTTVSGFVLTAALVAALRRRRVPAEDRYRLRLGRKLARLRGAIGAGSAVATLVNVALVVSVLVALTSVGFAFASPPQGERYTTLQVLSSTDSGDLVAGDYPTEVEPGESLSLTVGVENREGERTGYDVVVQEQWIDGDEVRERHELTRTALRVADGETVHDDLEFTPEASSGTVRIAILLYDGPVPDEPTTANAYRYAYVWVDIEEPIDDG